ncbi:MAG TPA: hypothetical protein VMP01_30130, partial [Pirellulaceae bacterium]|nr:hypothetical protein [Pirellulaceae bacterium]
MSSLGQKLDDARAAGWAEWVRSEADERVVCEGCWFDKRRAHPRTGDGCQARAAPGRCWATGGGMIIRRSSGPPLAGRFQKLARGTGQTG